MSVHGANRLGANSLLDIVVFGRACAHHIAENLKPGVPHKKIREDAGMDSVRALDEVRTSSGPKHTSEIRADMQRAMQVSTTRGTLRKVELTVLRFGCRTMPPCFGRKSRSSTVSRSLTAFSVPGRTLESRIAR